MVRAKASKLSNKKARLSFPIAKKAVFESLGDGVSVGYRRNASAGTWLVRKADGKGGSTQRVIGTADDYEDADGERVLTWGQAQASALERAHKEESVSPASRITVLEAITAYENDLRIRGGDVQNAARAKRHFPAGLASKAVTDLTTNDLRKWRDELLSGLTPSSVNRTANGLRAALELAARHNDSIVNLKAWKVGLAGLPDADEARNIILSDAVIGKLVRASYGVSAEFGLLVEVAAVTGARYSQIAGLRVSDMLPGSEHRLNMPTSKKGKGVKKILRRPVPIPTSVATKLAVAVKARKAKDSDALLVKSSGDAWAKSDHSRLFKRAVKAVTRADDFKIEEIAPNAVADLTLYALRHSSIVRSLLRNVPVRVVALQHDTSVAMIERNYSAHLADHADAIARLGMIDLGSEHPSATALSQPVSKPGADPLLDTESQVSPP